MSLVRRSHTIPSLDGIRAISIAMVMLAHLVESPQLPFQNQLQLLSVLGNLGVRIFFVISGFLITDLLLRELDDSGEVKLKRFYFRRVFRIFPAYYFYLLVMLAAYFIFNLQVEPANFLTAFTYTNNYYSDPAWILGHTWSLAVEEQFYLLWPLLLVLLGKRRALYAAIAAILLSPILRLLLFPTFVYEVNFRFETASDALAIGCVLALTRSRLHEIGFYAKLLNWRLFFLIPGVALLLAALTKYPSILSTNLYLLLGVSVANIAIGLSIDWAITNNGTVVGKLLNARPLVVMGVMSYSIYLWQQPFLAPYTLGIFTSLPVNIAVIAILALFSYFVVERPMLAMRRNLEPKIFKRSDPGLPLALSQKDSVS